MTNGQSDAVLSYSIVLEAETSKFVKSVQDVKQKAYEELKTVDLGSLTDGDDSTRQFLEEAKTSAGSKFDQVLVDRLDKTIQPLYRQFAASMAKAAENFASSASRINKSITDNEKVENRDYNAMVTSAAMMKSYEARMSALESMSKDKREQKILEKVGGAGNLANVTRDIISTIQRNNGGIYTTANMVRALAKDKSFQDIVGGKTNAERIAGHAVALAGPQQFVKDDIISRVMSNGMYRLADKRYYAISDVNPTFRDAFSVRGKTGTVAANAGESVDKVFYDKLNKLIASGNTSALKLARESGLAEVVHGNVRLLNGATMNQVNDFAGLLYREMHDVKLGSPLYPKTLIDSTRINKEMERLYEVQDMIAEYNAIKTVTPNILAANERAEAIKKLGKTYFETDTVLHETGRMESFAIPRVKYTTPGKFEPVAEKDYRMPAGTKRAPWEVKAEDKAMMYNYSQLAASLGIDAHGIQDTYGVKGANGEYRDEKGQAIFGTPKIIAVSTADIFTDKTGRIPQGKTKEEIIAQSEAARIRAYNIEHGMEANGVKYVIAGIGKETDYWAEETAANEVNRIRKQYGLDPVFGPEAAIHLLDENSAEKTNKAISNTKRNNTEVISRAEGGYNPIMRLGTLSTTAGHFVREMINGANPDNIKEDGFIIDGSGIVDPSSAKESFQLRFGFDQVKGVLSRTDLAKAIIAAYGESGTPKQLLEQGYERLLNEAKTNRLFTTGTYKTKDGQTNDYLEGIWLPSIAFENLSLERQREIYEGLANGTLGDGSPEKEAIIERYRKNYFTNVLETAGRHKEDIRPEEIYDSLIYGKDDFGYSFEPWVVNGRGYEGFLTTKMFKGKADIHKMKEAKFLTMMKSMGHEVSPEQLLEIKGNEERYKNGEVLLNAKEMELYALALQKATSDQGQGVWITKSTPQFESETYRLPASVASAMKLDQSVYDESEALYAERLAQLRDPLYIMQHGLGNARFDRAMDENPNFVFEDLGQRIVQTEINGLLKDKADRTLLMRRKAQTGLAVPNVTEWFKDFLAIGGREIPETNPLNFLAKTGFTSLSFKEQQAILGRNPAVLGTFLPLLNLVYGENGEPNKAVKDMLSMTGFDKYAIGLPVESLYSMNTGDFDGDTVTMYAQLGADFSKVFTGTKEANERIEAAKRKLETSGQKLVEDYKKQNPTGAANPQKSKINPWSEHLFNQQNAVSKMGTGYGIVTKALEYFGDSDEAYAYVKAAADYYDLATSQMMNEGKDVELPAFLQSLAMDKRLYTRFLSEVGANITGEEKQNASIFKHGLRGANNAASLQDMLSHGRARNRGIDSGEITRDIMKYVSDQYIDSEEPIREAAMLMAEVQAGQYTGERLFNSKDVIKRLQEYRDKIIPTTGKGKGLSVIETATQTAEIDELIKHLKEKGDRYAFKDVLIENVKNLANKNGLLSDKDLETLQNYVVDNNRTKDVDAVLDKVIQADEGTYSISEKAKISAEILKNEATGLQQSQRAILDDSYSKVVETQRAAVLQRIQQLQTNNAEELRNYLNWDKRSYSFTKLEPYMGKESDAYTMPDLNGIIVTDLATGKQEANTRSENNWRLWNEEQQRINQGEELLGKSTINLNAPIGSLMHAAFNRTARKITGSNGVGYSAGLYRDTLNELMDELIKEYQNDPTGQAAKDEEIRRLLSDFNTAFENDKIVNPGNELSFEDIFKFAKGQAGERSIGDNLKKKLSNLFGLNPEQRSFGDMLLQSLGFENGAKVIMSETELRNIDDNLVDLRKIGKEGRVQLGNGKTIAARPDLIVSRMNEQGNEVFDIVDFKSAYSGAIDSIYQSYSYVHELEELAIKAWNGEADEIYKIFMQSKDGVAIKDKNGNYVSKFTGGKVIGADLLNEKTYEHRVDQDVKNATWDRVVEAAGRKIEADKTSEAGVMALLDPSTPLGKIAARHFVQNNIDVAAARYAEERNKAAGITQENPSGNLTTKEYQDWQKRHDYLLGKFEEDRTAAAELNSELTREAYKYRDIEPTIYNKFRKYQDNLHEFMNSEALAAFKNEYKGLSWAEKDIKDFETNQISANEALNNLILTASEEDPKKAMEQLTLMKVGAKESQLSKTLSSINRIYNNAVAAREGLTRDAALGNLAHRDDRGNLVWDTEAKIIESMTEEEKDVERARAKKAEANKPVYESYNDIIEKLGSKRSEMVEWAYQTDVKDFSSEVDNLIQAPKSAEEKITDYYSKQQEKVQKMMVEATTRIESVVSKLKVKRSENGDIELDENGNFQYDKMNGSLIYGITDERERKAAEEYLHGMMQEKNRLSGGVSIDQVIQKKRKELGLDVETPDQQVDKWLDDRLAVLNIQKKEVLNNLFNGEGSVEDYNNIINEIMYVRKQAEQTKESLARQNEQINMENEAKLNGRPLTRDETKKLRAIQLKKIRDNWRDKFIKEGNKTEADRINSTYTDDYLDRLAERQTLEQERIQAIQLKNQEEANRIQNENMLYNFDRQRQQRQRQQYRGFATTRIAQSLLNLQDRRINLQDTIRSYDQRAVTLEGKKAEIQERLKITPDDKALQSQLAIVNNDLKTNAELSDKAKEELNGLSDASGVAATVFTSLGQSLQMVAMRLGRQLFQKATQETKRFVKEFDASMTTIQMITLKSDDQMKELGSSLIDRAKELKVSVADISNSAADLYRQGLTDSEVNERLGVISKFSKVSGTKVDSATKLITVAMNTGLVTQAQEAADIVTALGDSAATNAAEIEKGIEKAGAAAAVDGTTFGQLASMLTAITSTTQMGGRVAGTSLNTIFSRLNKIGKNELIYDENGNAVSGSAVANQLKEIGVDTYVNGKKRSSFDVLYNLSRKWEGLSDAQQQQISTSIAGTRQYSNFAAIMQGMAEGDIDRYLELIEGSTGITDKKYEAYTDSLAASLTNLQTTFDGLVNDVIDSGIVGDAIDGITRIIEGIDRIPGSLGKVLAALVPITLAMAGMQAMSWGPTGMAVGFGLLATAGIYSGIMGAIGSMDTRTELEKKADEYEEYSGKTDERNDAIRNGINRIKTLKEKGNTRTDEENKEYASLINEYAIRLGMMNESAGSAKYSIDELSSSINKMSTAADEAADSVIKAATEQQKQNWVSQKTSLDKREGLAASITNGLSEQAQINDSVPWNTNFENLFVFDKEKGKYVVREDENGGYLTFFNALANLDDSGKNLLADLIYNTVGWSKSDRLSNLNDVYENRIIKDFNFPRTDLKELTNEDWHDYLERMYAGWSPNRNGSKSDDWIRDSNSGMPLYYLPFVDAMNELLNSVPYQTGREIQTERERVVHDRVLSGLTEFFATRASEYSETYGSDYLDNLANDIAKEGASKWTELAKNGASNKEIDEAVYNVVLEHINDMLGEGGTIDSIDKNFREYYKGITLKQRGQTEESKDIYLEDLGTGGYYEVQFGDRTERMSAEEATKALIDSGYTQGQVEDMLAGKPVQQSEIESNTGALGENTSALGALTSALSEANESLKTDEQDIEEKEVEENKTDNKDEPSKTITIVVDPQNGTHVLDALRLVDTLSQEETYYLKYDVVLDKDDNGDTVFDRVSAILQDENYTFNADNIDKAKQDLTDILSVYAIFAGTGAETPEWLNGLFDFTKDLGESIEEAEKEAESGTEAQFTIPISVNKDQALQDLGEIKDGVADLTSQDHDVIFSFKTGDDDLVSRVHGYMEDAAEGNLSFDLNTEEGMADAKKALDDLTAYKAIIAAMAGNGQINVDVALNLLTTADTLAAQINKAVSSAKETTNTTVDISVVTDDDSISKAKGDIQNIIDLKAAANATDILLKVAYDKNTKDMLERVKGYFEKYSKEGANFTASMDYSDLVQFYEDIGRYKSFIDEAVTDGKISAGTREIVFRAVVNVKDAANAAVNAYNSNASANNRINIDADPSLANSKCDELVSSINNKTGSVKVDANTDAAEEKLNFIQDRLLALDKAEREFYEEGKKVQEAAIAETGSFEIGSTEDMALSIRKLGKRSQNQEKPAAEERAEKVAELLNKQAENFKNLVVDDAALETWREILEVYGLENMSSIVGAQIMNRFKEDNITTGSTKEDIIKEYEKVLEDIREDFNISNNGIDTRRAMALPEGTFMIASAAASDVGGGRGKLTESKPAKDNGTPVEVEVVDQPESEKKVSQNETITGIKAVYTGLADVMFNTSASWKTAYNEKAKIANFANELFSNDEIKTLEDLNNILTEDANKRSLFSSILAKNEELHNLMQAARWDKNTKQWTGVNIEDIKRAVKSSSSIYGSRELTTQQKAKIALEGYNGLIESNWYMTKEEKDEEINRIQEEIDKITNEGPVDEKTLNSKYAKIEDIRERGVLTSYQGLYLTEALGQNLFDKVIDAAEGGEDKKLTEEEKTLIDTILNNRKYGITSLTDKQRYSGMSEVVSRISEDKFFGEKGYSREAADMYMSQWSDWGTYIGLKQKENDETITEDEIKLLNNLQLQLDEVMKNARINLEISGVQELENAGEIAAGTAEKLKKLREGGIVTVDVIMQIQSEAFSFGQLIEKLLNGTDLEKDEAAMALGKMNRDEYYADRNGNLETWQNYARTYSINQKQKELELEYKLAPEERKSEIEEAAKKAGFKAKFADSESEDLSKEIHEGDFLGFEYVGTDINYTNPAAGKQQYYSDVKLAMARNMILSGELTPEINPDLYYAAYSGLGSYGQEYTRLQYMEAPEDQLNAVRSLAEYEQNEALYGIASQYYKKMAEGQQALTAVSDLTDSDNLSTVSSYLGFDSSFIQSQDSDVIKQLVETKKKNAENVLIEAIKSSFESIDIDSAVDGLQTLDFSGIGDVDSLVPLLKNAATTANDNVKGLIEFWINVFEGVSNVIPRESNAAFDLALGNLNKETYQRQGLLFINNNLNTARNKAQEEGTSVTEALFGLNGWNTKWESSLFNDSSVVAALSLINSNSSYVPQIQELLNTKIYGSTKDSDYQTALGQVLFGDMINSQGMFNEVKTGADLKNLKSQMDKIFESGDLKTLFDDWASGLSAVGDALDAIKDNDVDKLSKALGGLNEEIAGKKADEATRYSKSVNGLQENIKGLLSGGTDAKKAKMSLDAQMKNLQDQKTALTKASGKSGAELKKAKNDDNDPALDILADMLPYNANQLAEMTAKQIQDLLDDAGPILDEQLQGMFDALFSELHVDPEINLKDAITVHTDGSIDVSPVAGMIDEASARILQMILTLAGQYAEVDLKAILKGDKVKIDAIVNALKKAGVKSGGGYSGGSGKSGGGGGGGGGSEKSAAAKLLDAQKDRIASIQHENNLLSIYADDAARENNLPAYQDLINAQIDGQTELRDAYQQNIAELQNMLSTLDAESDEWNQIQDAIRNAEEEVAKYNANVAALEEKMLQEVKDKYDYETSITGHTGNMIETENRRNRRLNDYAAWRENIAQKASNYEAQIILDRNYAGAIQTRIDEQIAAGNGNTDYVRSLQEELNGLIESSANLYEQIEELSSEIVELNSTIRENALQTPTHWATIYANEGEVARRNRNWGYSNAITNQQLLNNEEQRGILHENISRVVEDLKNAVIGSTQWHELLQQIYTDEESLLQLTLSDMDLELQRLNDIKSAFDETISHIQHIETQELGEFELNGFSNNYTGMFTNLNNYTLALQARDEMLSAYISALNEQLNDAKTAEAQEEIRKQIEQVEEERLRLAKDMNDVWEKRLSILEEKHEREISPIQYDETMLEYQEQLYGRLNDYGGYVGTIEKMNQARRNSIATLKDQQNELKEEQQLVERGSDAWWELQKRIEDADKRIAEDTKAIDDNNKKRLEALQVKQQNEDRNENHAYDMFGYAAERAQLIEDHDAWEDMMNARIDQIRESIIQNSRQVKEAETLLSTYVEGSEEWLKTRDLIWNIKKDTAQKENETLKIEKQIDEQRLAEIQRDTTRRNAYDTHQVKELDIASNVYQTFGNYDNYREALNKQYNAYERLRESSIRARNAVLQQMSALEKGTSSWYNARDAVYAYDEAIASTTNTMLEKQIALEASNIQQVATEYNNAQIENNALLQQIRSQRQMYDNANDFENYQQLGLKEKEVLDQQIEDKKAYVESMQALLKETTKGTSNWYNLRSSIAQALNDIANMEVQSDQLARQQEQNKIDHMLDKMNYEDSNRQHNLTLIQYEQTRYQNSGELSNYGIILEKENELRQKSIEANLLNIQKLKEEQDTLVKGSTEYNRLTEEIKKKEEAIKSDTIELEKNTKAIKENADAIQRTRKELEDSVDKEIKTREEQRKKRLNSEVNLQKTILDTIKQRLTDEWDLEKKDLEKKQEALRKEKDLINERLNARKKAAETEEKYSELEELQRQLALISNDPTRTKDVKELRKRIKDIEKDISWDKAFEEAETATKQIDDEIQAITDYTTVHGDNLEEMLQNANSFAEQVATIMAGGWESVSTYLIENNKEFNNSLAEAQQEMLEGWEQTWKDMNGIIDTYWDQISEILSSYENFVNFMKDSTEYITASDASKAVLEFGWEVLYDNWVKSGFISPEAENYETDEHPWYDVTSGNAIDDIFNQNFDWLNWGKESPAVALDDTLMNVENYDDNGKNKSTLDLIEIMLDDIYSGTGISRKGEIEGYENGFSYSGPVVVHESDLNINTDVPYYFTADYNPYHQDYTGYGQASGTQDYWYNNNVSQYNENYTPSNKTTTSSNTNTNSKTSSSKSSTTSSNSSTTSNKTYTTLTSEPLKPTYTTLESEPLKSTSSTTNNAVTTATTAVATVAAALTAAASAVKNLLGFDEGGLVDFTGPAWVDGTKARPEAFLDAEDTQLIRKMVDSLNYVSLKPGVWPDSGMFSSGSTTYGNISITINQAELKKDADYEDVARRIGKAFTKEMSRKGYNLTGYNL